jgi:hypothetical protein
MSLAEELLSFEHKQFRALASADEAVAFYREYLIEDGLLAGPFGILDRETTIQMVPKSALLTDYNIKSPQFVQLTESSALIVYQMTQNRQGMDPYDANVCTVYVRRDGQWRIAFHQQTPLAEI